jgi:nitrite reductase/ring-hydroxylating ferredoxin subunit
VTAVIRLINEDEILVELGDLKVIAQSQCPHRKGRLRYGTLNERRMTITCPLHHSTFDLRTGSQLSGPPCGSLKVSVVESG